MGMRARCASPDRSPRKERPEKPQRVVLPAGALAAQREDQEATLRSLTQERIPFLAASREELR